jgi:hypothetical protein
MRQSLEHIFGFRKRVLITQRRMFVFKWMTSVAATAAILGIGAGSVNATIIVDSVVESGSDWVAPGGFPNFNVISPLNQDGNPPARMRSDIAGQNTVSLPSSSAAFSGRALGAGTYTLEFAMGDYSNQAFPAARVVNFGPLQWRWNDLTDASSATTPVPPNGGWELWTITFDVGLGDSRIGQPLDFQFVQTSGGGLTMSVLDGVGNLSPNGTGFLVDFASIPEPSTVMLMLLGGLGLVLPRRRRAR